MYIQIHSLDALKEPMYGTRPCCLVQAITWQKCLDPHFETAWFIRLEISCEIGSGWGKEGPREDRESQLTKEGRREQSAWDRCPDKDTVSRRRQREDGSRAVKRWVSIPSGFVEVSCKIHARDSLQMHGKLHKSVTNSLLLHSELTQVRVCLFVLFLHLLGCILCICNTLGKGMNPIILPLAMGK